MREKWKEKDERSLKKRGGSEEEATGEFEATNSKKETEKELLE